MPAAELTADGTVQELQRCAACEQPNRAEARFCGHCGMGMAAECPKCGADNPRNLTFCDACGAALPATSSSVSNPALSSETSAERIRHRSFSLPYPRISGISAHLRPLGLTWDSPVIEWRWSLPFLKEWAYTYRWEVLAVIVLTAIAAFLRIYRLGDYPAGFHGDEAWSGLEAQRILEEGWIGLQSGSALGQAAGTFYVTALLILFLDASIFTVRLSMAIFGIATIPAAYLLFRIGFGRLAALFATAALAVSHWHLHMSRVTFPVVALPFACTVAAAALIFAMRSRSRLAWPVAGALLGLAPYTYFAYPSFFAATLAVLAVYLFLQRDQLQPTLLSLALFSVGLIVVLTPVISTIVSSPTVQTGRMGQVWVFRSHEFPQGQPLSEQAGFLAQRTWDSLTLLMRNPRVDGTDGSGGKGAVDMGVAILAYVGLAVSVRRWRSPPYLLALLAVLGALSVLVVTDPSTGTLRRSITAIPWVFGLAGVGVVSIVNIIRSGFGEGGRIAAVGALALVLIAGSFWNLQYYFDELAQSNQLDWAFAPDHVEALESAHAFDDPGTIYFYSSRWAFDYESVRFLYPESTGINRSDEFGTFDLTKVDDGPVTYVLIGHYAQEIDRLTQLYPGGDVIVDNEHRPRFIVYHLNS